MKFLGILGGLALIAALFASPAQSQTVKPILSNTCTLSVAGQPCLLNGMGAQSTCVVTLTGTWSGTVSFFILDPQQLTTQAIKGWAPDGSGTGGTTTTSNVTGWSFPCAAQASFETVFTTASSGSVVVQEWATTGVGYRAPNGAGGGTLTGLTAGTNIVVNPSGAPAPTVAVTAAPVFSGAIVGNAAATASPAPSGYNGTAVIAQATAAPTAQPGYVSVAGGFTSGSSTYGPISATVNGDITATSINGFNPTFAFCTDSTAGVITCSATVAYTSTKSYACGMSYVGPASTTGAATGTTVVNTSATSVTGTIVGLSLATGTATLMFNCLGS